MDEWITFQSFAVDRQGFFMEGTPGNGTETYPNTDKSLYRVTFFIDGTQTLTVPPMSGFHLFKNFWKEGSPGDHLKESSCLTERGHFEDFASF